MPKLKMLMLLAIPVFAVFVAGNASAAGGQRILSSKKTCQLTVPNDWKVGNKYLHSFANSPDKTLGAIISSGGDDTTLSEAKSIMESAYKPVKILEDSPHRLWYEYQGPNEGFGYYVGVPGRQNNVCGAQITFKHAGDADKLKPIALSVGPAS